MCIPQFLYFIHSSEKIITGSRLGTAHSKLRLCLLLHINPPLSHSSPSANHFLRLTFIFFIHPFIPNHSLSNFTADWFNPFLLIISPHSSGFCIHIFTCLFSSRSIINLGSFCERDLFPSTP